MPLRAGHIPHHRERIALQKMSATQGLPLEKLYPVGKNTVERMIAKGWVLRELDAKAGARFCITPAGQAALKAKI
jgi:hypothetical protein